jgi:DNA-binding transcriptional LysR family regulator
MSSSSINVGQLKSFLAVLEEGGFTAAAHKLGLTQSGVSQAVAALEESLGVVLLLRNRGRVAPTAAGAAIQSDARQALEAIERVRHRAQVLIGLQSGRVRVGSVASAAARLLPPIVKNFGARYPGIEVVLIEGTDAEVRDWVVGGAIDIGLTAEIPKDYDAVPVAEDDFLAIMPRKHRFAQRRSIKPTELAEEPFVMSNAGCEDEVREIFHRNGVAPKIAFSVRDPAALLAMVREGVGVSIVPELVVPSGERRLAAIPLEPAARRKLCAVARKAALAPAARAFLDSLAAAGRAHMSRA